MKLFDAAIYQNRRKALMQAMGSGILIFPGAAEQPMNYKANTYPFRQDSSFLYYFGFSQPGLDGIIDADNGQSILVGEDADLEEVIWMGPQPSMQQRIEQIGAEKSMTHDELAGFVSGRKVYRFPVEGFCSW